MKEDLEELKAALAGLEISISLDSPDVRLKSPRRRRRGNKAQDVVMKSFVVFDVETTGLSAANDEIIEIGAVKVLDIHSEEHATFSFLVKPSRKISRRITTITGITNEMLEDGISEEEAIRGFCEFIGDLPLVAHNASFDSRFVKATAGRHGLDIDNMLIDTLSLARKAFPDLQNHKLPTLVEHFNIETIAHRALEDSHSALRVYIESVSTLYRDADFMLAAQKKEPISIYRAADTPLREKPSFDERWNMEDKGLITAWEVGRRKADESPSLATRAKNGELPKLVFKGGHARKLTSSEFKYGTFQYLAQWKGLRGDPLDINTDRDEGLEMVCTKTGMATIFTSNTYMYMDQ